MSDVYENYKIMSKAQMVHGGLPARGRKQIMRRIKNHEFRNTLPATLLRAALIFPDVSHVITLSIAQRLELLSAPRGSNGSHWRGLVINLIDYDDDGAMKLLTFP